jgi:hypothetical protein
MDWRCGSIREAMTEVTPFWVREMFQKQTCKRDMRSNRFLTKITNL